MKVKVCDPFQVCHDGVVYPPGERADVPEAIARHWLRCGWVDAVDAAAKRVKADVEPPAAVVDDPADEFGHNTAGSAAG